MQLKKIESFIKTELSKTPAAFEKIIKDVPFKSIYEEIENIRKASNKERYITDLSKKLSKIIDYYEENDKVGINREAFIEEYFNKIKSFIPKKDINDSKASIELILSNSIEYDENNWKVIFDNIDDSIKNNEINKNALYSLNYQDLIPKSLIDIFKKESNEIFSEGHLAFESCTQEMLGVINEFVLLTGAEQTKKYLEQGLSRKEKNDLKYPIVELLKEVNAASLMDLFSFDSKTNKPIFKKAKSGQFDGFLIHNNKVKILLATKDENTFIEGDSLFRHCVTAMLIKKRMDETEVNESEFNRKMQKWVDFYTADNKLEQKIRKEKEYFSRLKMANKELLTVNDCYIPKNFLDKLNDKINDAESRGLYEITIDVLDSNRNSLLDRKYIKHFFKKDMSKSQTGRIKLSVEDAMEHRDILSSVIDAQEKWKNELSNLAKEKILKSEKFQKQVEIDVKKQQVAVDDNFYSLANMISHYNRNTKDALEKLGIINPNIKEQDLNSDLKNVIPTEVEKDVGKLHHIDHETMDKFKELKKELGVDLIYYGSVSNKKSENEYYYDESNNLTNKEFRFGLNVIAYANILRNSIKDKVTMSEYAALKFVNSIDLRTLTKENKENSYDIDLEKINSDDFIPDVIHTVCSQIYHNKVDLENDSINCFENLFNVTNVILADFIEDIQDKDGKLRSYVKDVKEEFSIFVNNYTGREFEYDLKETMKTLKNISLFRSNKFIHGGSIIETVNNKLEKIANHSKDPELLEIVNIEKTYNNSQNKDKKSRMRKKL